jgi:CRISPR/Cas system-associated exonuclease Cas4 (RecB family)
LQYVSRVWGWTWGSVRIQVAGAILGVSDGVSSAGARAEIISVVKVGAKAEREVGADVRMVVDAGVSIEVDVEMWIKIGAGVGINVSAEVRVKVVIKVRVAFSDKSWTLKKAGCSCWCCCIGA